MLLFDKRNDKKLCKRICQKYSRSISRQTRESGTCVNQFYVVLLRIKKVFQRTIFLETSGLIFVQKVSTNFSKLSEKIFCWLRCNFLSQDKLFDKKRVCRNNFSTRSLQISCLVNSFQVNRCLIDCCSCFISLL